MKRLLFGSVAIAGIILLIFWQGKEAGKTQATAQQQKVIIKNKETEIKAKNDFIKESQNVAKRQAKARAVPISNDLVWLQQNICQDCDS